MKKITLFAVALMLSTLIGVAQSQRLVLVEEFTQASCPPCASQNPAFNAVLNANPAKLVSIKYQTSWPGVDPMNAQNATQVATRVTYYSVTGVPTASQDGDVYANPGQPTYPGAPYIYSQGMVDNEYAIPSPFTVAVSHTMSATNDTIFAHATITCTQAVSGTLVAHMAIVERNIYFTTAPGTNGEKHFESVMKKMLPSDQGTTIASSWASGDVSNIDLSWKLASVYDANQLAVVFWIQDNSSKNVLQAGYSRPHITNDAGITGISGVNAVQCATTINPVVTIHNFATNPLSTCTIHYQVDAGTVQSATWNGNIATDNETTFTLPTITLTTGVHTLTVSTVSPNGNTDMDVHNDASTRSITVFAAPTMAPVTQNFSGGFPPTAWTRENVDGDAYTWQRSTASYGGGTGSAKSDCYDGAAGTIDNLYPPIFDYSSAVAGATLEFDVSHARYTNAYSDRLKVNISTNCGTTWTTVWNKADPALATVNGVVIYDSTTAFTPTATQWSHQVINMTPYIGQASVLVQFQSISGYGNNIYVDNVNINTTAPSGINDPVINADMMSVYPNPSNGEFNVKLDLKQTQNITIIVTNPLGEVVRTMDVKNASSGVYPVNLANEAKGNYLVTVKAGTGSVSKRIAITQ